MEAMAEEKKVMAQLGNNGDEVVNPSKSSSMKFCKPIHIFQSKKVTQMEPEGRGGGTQGTGCKGNPPQGGNQSASHG